MSQQEVKELNFNGKVYAIDDLTIRAKEGFNLLLKVQAKVNELASDLKVQQAAQIQLTADVQQILEEDKIEEVKATEE
jgi:hypothetical protein